MSVVVGSHVERGNVRRWIHYVSRMADEAERDDERVPVWISDMGDAEVAADNVENLLSGSSRTNGGESLVLSFPSHEMDIDNDEDLQEAGDLAYELSKRIAPNSPTIVGVHVDSKGGMVHAHILIVNHDYSTGLSNQENMRITRCRRVNDELMEDTGHEVCPLPEVTGPSFWSKGTVASVALEDATDRDAVRQYLREQVDIAMSEPGVESLEDLVPAAAERGISLEILPDNGNGRTVTVAAVDDDGQVVRNQQVRKSGKVTKIKVAQNGKKLGSAYTAEGIEQRCADAAQQRQQQADDLTELAATDTKVAEAVELEKAAKREQQAAVGGIGQGRATMREKMRLRYGITLDQENTDQASEDQVEDQKPEKTAETTSEPSEEPDSTPTPAASSNQAEKPAETVSEEVETSAPIVTPDDDEVRTPPAPPVTDDDEDEEEIPAPSAPPADAADPGEDDEPESDLETPAPPVDVDALVKDALNRAPWAYVAEAQRYTFQKNGKSLHDIVMLQLEKRISAGDVDSDELSGAYADITRRMPSPPGSDATTLCDFLSNRMRHRWYVHHGSQLADREPISYEDYQRTTYGAKRRQSEERWGLYARMEAEIVDRDRQPGG